VYVPAVWLHLPYWFMPALVAGVAAAMLYRVTTELLDGVCGLLAVLLLLSMSECRFLALVVMSHVVMLALGLTLMWAWLHWRSRPRLAWAALIGALGGWAAITRPADALCWSIPIAIAMLWTMRDWPRRRAVTTMATILLAAAPFLAVQGVFSRGVTGRWLYTPYQMYCDRYTPQSIFGFHRVDPAATPASTLPQLIAYHEQFIHPAAQHHRVETMWSDWMRERFPRIAAIALPSQWLLVFIPVSLLATTRARWVLLGVLPLALAMYAMFAFLLAHYVVLMAPAIIFAVRDWVTTVVVVVIIVFSLRAMPQFNRLVRDDVLDMPVTHFDHNLPRMVQQPAIVLYRFNPSGNPHDEPVYNTDVAWPDEAPIIRAHDRSPEQNQRLFSYYAQRQPDRQVYLVDRDRVIADLDYRPQHLGRVADLAGSR
jgi:4-amino-4-deoxy-L-arabinose transferase-like glycosyltransferase